MTSTKKKKKISNFLPVYFIYYMRFWYSNNRRSLHQLVFQWRIHNVHATGVKVDRGWGGWGEGERRAITMLTISSTLFSKLTFTLFFFLIFHYLFFNWPLLIFIISNLFNFLAFHFTTLTLFSSGRLEEKEWGKKEGWGGGGKNRYNENIDRRI